MLQKVNGSEFPTFVNYIKEFNVLKFSNITRESSGQTFAFAIVVKEKNSVYVSTQYKASVHVNAAIIVEQKKVEETANVTVNETIVSNTTSNESLSNHS